MTHVHLRILLSYRVDFIFSLFVLYQIVSLGMPTVSPTERVGKYVSPRDWNALISDPDVVSKWPLIYCNFQFRFLIMPDLLGSLFLSDTFRLQLMGVLT